MDSLAEMECGTIVKKNVSWINGNLNLVIYILKIKLVSSGVNSLQLELDPVMNSGS